LAFSNSSTILGFNNIAKMKSRLFLRVLLFQRLAMMSGTTWALTTIATTAKSKLEGPAVLDFLATASNWPAILITSNRVETVGGSTTPSKKNKTKGTSTTAVPLKRGDSVKEFLGLAGLDLLSVTWNCVESTPTSLVLRSNEGIQGIAEDCSIQFSVAGKEVSYVVQYNSVSMLGVLAGPVVAVDGWMSLNVFLPAAVDPTPLNSFRTLMGSLYGMAGVAHLVDLLVGPSTLLVAAGTFPFASLPLLGQVYALLWCATGPISYLASRSERQQVADLGLVLYGLVEVYGAYLTTSSDAFVNAIAVQGVVGSAWLYTRQNQLKRQVE
jgi:hypothetical protein